MSRPLETSELIQMLLEARQPHALVEVQLEVEDKCVTTCECSEPAVTIDTHSATVRVVGVRSALNKVVLEVVE